MVQHINLLIGSRSTRNLVWISSRFLILVLILSVFWIFYSEYKLNQLKNNIVSSGNKLVLLREELKQKRRLTGLEDAQVLINESNQMRQNLESQHDLMVVIQKGEIGSLIGHFNLLRNLATLSQSGVWLTYIEISHAGQSLGITGSALQTTDIMNYTSHLTDSIRPLGIEFSSLEIINEDSLDSFGVKHIGTLKFNLK